MSIVNLAEKLYREHNLSDSELKEILLTNDGKADEALQKYAQKVRDKIFGKNVYIRGLIEVSNYCKNDCYYCGIRRSNKNICRYRLTKEQILDCCKKGYELGFRTFVLQGGEDFHYSDDDICSIVSEIKNNFSDCAVTLSIGERSYESYKKYYDAGADRFLLREETSNPLHYRKLHPQEMSLKNRIQCLYNLKEIGYQVGCGIMIGSPYQTVDDIILDLRFFQKFMPHMIGIGPFVPHKDTDFRDKPIGGLKLTLRTLGIIRLMINDVLLPSTTALSTIDTKGRILGILYGGNVVMPNLSPQFAKENYTLYDGKLSTGKESGEMVKELEKSLENFDYSIEISRGDTPRK